MHGTLVTAKFIGGKIHISIYHIYEYYIQVSRKIPGLEIIDIVPVINMREFSTYLGLDDGDSSPSRHAH